MSKGIVFRNHQNEKIYPCPFYPIGSVYISFSATDPSTYFGGSWERIKGRFLLSADDGSYNVNNTGGEATHTLTINEMPSHGHSLTKHVPYGVPYNNTSGASANAGGGGFYGETYNPPWTVNNTGGSQPPNNMPPYIVVYMWRRRW